MIGAIHITEEKSKRVMVVTDDAGEAHEFDVPYNTRSFVQEGARVAAGDALNEGSLDRPEIMEYKGENALQQYLVQEVQKVYRSQGVDINDKHIETVVRSMLRKVKIVDGGDTRMLPGRLIEKRRLRGREREDGRRGQEDRGRQAGAARGDEGVARETK